jgi:hypothetical protein
MHRISLTSTDNTTPTIVPTSSSQSISVAAPSPIIITLSNSEAISSSTSSLNLHSSFSESSSSTLEQASNISGYSLSSLSSSFWSNSHTTTLRTPQQSPTTQTPSVTFSKSPDQKESSSLQSTSPYGSGNAATKGSCTGCVIEAYNPITTSFGDNFYDQWTSTLVTATVVTSFITYNDTVVTNSATVNVTKTITNIGNSLITHTTPVFTVEPTPGMYVTLDAGPTYVIYNKLYGGLDKTYSNRWAFPNATVTMNTCVAEPTLLKNWEPARTEDWTYLIATYTNSAPTTTATNVPYPLPSGLVQYLKQNLAILSQYHGSNIETCTIFPTAGLQAPMPVAPPNRPQPQIPQAPTTEPEPEATKTHAIPPFFSVSTKTFLATTYETTSTHVTVAGCLRCQNTKPPPEPTPNVPEFSEKGHNAQPEPTPNQPGSPDKPHEQSNPSDTPSNPNDNQGGAKPSDGKSNDQRPPGNPIVIGDTTYTVRPGNPTPAPDRPSNQNQPPPAIVIGSQTLTQGESTVINGVPVVVPSDAGGSRVVVGGTTYVVNNGPTAAPVLTVGQSTVTANPQGQFVVGSETLKPGGPAVTVDGSTLSLGTGGTIAIVNGVTQTLANAPVMTSPPVITVGDRVVSATVLGGTTQLVLDGQTLVPGGSPITVSGTTYSLPASDSGTRIVVNGVTSTLSPGQIGSATVKDGTTAFILAPGQTLTPGGILTISGTTYSMPSGSPSIIVINGVTSTLAPSNAQITAAPALTINGQTYSATTRDGTTEYILGQGTTLKPGQAVTLSGVTYSLDPKGTALVINGQTSRIATGPVSASASASTTSGRDVGDFIWSGIGGGGKGAGSTSRAGAAPVGVERWVEWIIMGVAGWMMMLLF